MTSETRMFSKSGDACRFTGSRRAVETHYRLRARATQFNVARRVTSPIKKSVERKSHARASRGTAVRRRHLLHIIELRAPDAEVGPQMLFQNRRLDRIRIKRWMGPAAMGAKFGTRLNAGTEPDLHLQPAISPRLL